MAIDENLSRNKKALKQNELRAGICVKGPEGKMPLRGFLESLPSGTRIVFPVTSSMRKMFPNDTLIFKKK